MSTQISARQKFLETAHFNSGQVVLVSGYHWFWPETIERWEKEGLVTEGFLVKIPLSEYFEFDRMEEIPINFGLIPPFKIETLEENARYKTIIDNDGAKKKVFKEYRTSSMDQWLEYPVKDRRTWREYKKRLDPHSPGRCPPPGLWSEKKERYKVRDHPLGIFTGSLFGWMRNWIGIENLSYLLTDDPALIEEIVEYVEYFIIETIKPVLLEEVDLDFAHFWEDMAYKNGPLVSPKFVKKYMMSPYRKITDLLHNKGIDIITVDSDGDIRELIPLWLDCGINGMLPNEVTANMQIVDLRKEYKDLIIIGGIDKRVLSRGKKEIKKEIMDKIPYLLSTSGYFPAPDHFVPPDVPLENFLYYLEVVKKLITIQP
jgi:uroporphyrinogen decarboxylase